MPFRSRLLSALTLTLSAIVPAFADDTPAPPEGRFDYPRGGPARTGAYPEVRITDKPATVWADGMGKDCGAPVIAGDRLIVGDRNGHLVAVRLDDGLQVWAVTEFRWNVMTAPLVMDGKIYVASNFGLSARALADGSEIWRKEIGGGAMGSSPLGINGLVIVAGYDGNVYALDATSGQVRWTADIVKDAPPDPEGFDGKQARIGNAAARPNTAASDGKLVYLTIFDQSRVLALDAATGETKWSFQTKGWISGGATVGEGKVFVGSQDNSVYALEAETGRKLWTFETRWAADGDLAYHDGSVFIAAGDGRCYRIDAATGRKIWVYETEVGPDKKHFFLSGAPLIDATAVYFGSYDGYLYALNRNDGTLKWRHRPDVNNEHVGSPITDGKKLYVPLTPLFDFDKQVDQAGIHGIAAIGALEE